MLLQRTHTTVKQTLKIKTGEPISLWHKYASIAVLNYNISYHTSTGCEPSRVFQGRIPYNSLDLKLRIRPNQAPFPTSQIAENILDQTQTIYQDIRRNAMQSYLKYTAYYE